MSGIDWTPFLLSFKLAGVTTLILFGLALPLAWWLARTRSRAKPFVEAVTALPIVLPPSVLGFYLLWGLSPQSPLGPSSPRRWGSNWSSVSPAWWWPAASTPSRSWSSLSRAGARAWTAG
jgi:ABC-type molybdate transport system permease subunit